MTMTEPGFNRLLQALKELPMHSPTPWRMAIPANIYADGNWIATTNVNPITNANNDATAANARFIVKAVNNYHALVEALEAAIHAHKHDTVFSRDCWCHRACAALDLVEEPTNA